MMALFEGAANGWPVLPRTDTNLRDLYSVRPCMIDECADHYANRVTTPEYCGSDLHLSGISTCNYFC